ncbi:MAG: tetratricopeptide repeat protein [Thermoguttaceae bacterium]
MRRIGIPSLSPFWICPLLSLTVGCAGLRLPDPPTEDIAEKRRLRADEATQHFDTGRDFAQLQDAAARWTQGDVEGCEEELQRLLVRNPQHRDARLLLADVCMADGRRQEALEHVQAVLDTYPHDICAKQTMGLLRDTDGEPVEAAAYYRRAAEAEPGDELYPLSYQTASSADSDYVGSTDISDPSNPQIPISAATAALRSNQPALALELLTVARRQFPNSAAIHRILGVAHYRLGNYESSQVALQQALSLDNSAAVSYFLMGCTQAKLGQPESADANFRRARAIDPTYSARQ